jgi:hypothetical protein
MPVFVRLSLALVLTLGTAPAFAQSSARSPSAAARVADGQPWSMTMANGGTGQATFARDGTAALRMGPMNVRPTWRETADGMCMTLPVGGERCVRLRAEATGFAGLRPDGEVEFRLTR